MAHHPIEPSAGQAEPAAHITDQAAAQAALVAHCEQARRSVRLFSPRLESALLAGSELSETLGRFARHDRGTEVRILVIDAQSLAMRGHRLLELSRRLPSAVSMRQASLDSDKELPECVLIDRHCVLEMPSWPREGLVVGNANPRHNRTLTETFDAIWQRSHTPVGLRQLSL